MGVNLLQIDDNFYGDARTTLTNGIGVLPYNIGDALNGDTLPFNAEWSLSICPWAIGLESEIFNVWYPVSDTIDGYNSTFSEMPLFNEEKFYPFCLTVDGTTAIAPAQKTLVWSGRNAYDQTEISTVDVNTQYRNFRRIVTEFNYQNLVVMPYIIVASNDYDGMPVEYNTWLNDSYYHNKNICGIKFDVYYHNGTRYERNPNNIAFTSMAIGAPCQGLTATYNAEWLDYSYGITSDSFASVGTNGEAMAYPSGENFDNKMMPIPHGEHWKYHARTTYGGSVSYFPVLDRNVLTTDADILDWLCTQTAFLGTYFVLNSSMLTPDLVLKNNENVYIGEINSDGVTTGRYFKGSAMEELDQTDWINPIPIIVRDPDPSTYDDNTTILNNVRVNPKFCTRYALTSTEITTAYRFLMSEIAANVDSDFWSAQTLYVNNPIDVVQNVMLFPFDISQFQTDEPSYQYMTFGQLQDTDLTVQLNREQNIIIDMGKCTYFPKFGDGTLNERITDFRNYQPYSTATLYIPYCGSVEIDPAAYMGREISVKMIVDMGAGSCLALIYRDKMVVDSVSGQIGITIPITGLQSQTIAAAEHQATAQLKTAKSNAITKIAKGTLSIAGGVVMGGGIGGAAMALYQQKYGDIGNAVRGIQNAQFDLEHIEVPYKTIGTATASTSFANERKCRLIIRRPYMLSYDPVAYGHTVGYACLQTHELSDYHGFTQLQSVDLSGISATETEKTRIYELLKAGVYL